MSSSTVAAPPIHRHGARHWISAWLPVAIGIGVIACESTTYFGSDHTTGPLRVIWEWIFSHVSDETWEFIHHIIRKSGHFIGYGTLGLLWLRAWWMTRSRSRFFTNAFLGLAGTALVASADEFHQSFLPNRTGTPWDVLLDCTGAVVLMSLIWLILRLTAPRRLARAA
jgi:VanZ family protein